MVGLYPNVPHELGLKALKEALEKRDSIQISTLELVEMAKFVLQNNYFEFNGETKQQISGNAIALSLHLCIYIHEPSWHRIQQPLM